MLRVLILAMVVSCGGSSYRSGSGVASSPSLLANHSWQDPTVTGVTAVPGSAGGEMIALASAPDARSKMDVSPVLEAIGGVFAGSPGPAVAQVITAPATGDPEKLVIEAWFELRMDDVAAAAAAIRARVEADGGRVVSENVVGPASAASSAALELRVPPLKAAEFQTWLATRGVVESRRVLASDVSKTLFDQKLALQNLALTMSRLQKLAERDLPMKELLELETEMTRVRGQIERIEGEQRWLIDRVAFATITLTLRREGGPIQFAPHARIHPGTHLALLGLLDADGRPKSRFGGGVTIHVQRYFTLDLDVFPARGTDTRALITTIGSALYSSFLGDGRRRTLNPYLGFRAGYGYLSGEGAGVIGGELGLELYKQKYLLIEASARAVVFFRDDKNDVALHARLGFEVPF